MQDPFHELRELKELIKSDGEEEPRQNKIQIMDWAPKQA